MYINGVGVTQDPQRGFDYLRRSADVGGFPQARAVYALALADMGRDEEARHYYRLAAESGLPRAAFDLACAYRDGFGGPRDTVQAVRWFLKMLDVGDGDGVHEAIELAHEMTHDEIRLAARPAGRVPEGEALIEVTDKRA